jgi:hypothetical protein
MVRLLSHLLHEGAQNSLLIRSLRSGPKRELKRDKRVESVPIHGSAVKQQSSDTH